MLPYLIGLMTLCLKKIHSLQKKNIKVIDTKWVWTEPHSKRLQLSLDIERGILDEKILLRKRFIVNFIVVNKQCSSCQSSETEHDFGAIVQVRQKLDYKRSLYHLENLLLKSGLSESITNIELKRDGLDFYFRNKNNAEKVVDFISSSMPTKSKASKKLVSHNSQSNTARQEFTYMLELASLVKDDLTLTPKDLTGTIDIMLVSKISSSIHLINPFTLNKIDLTPIKYFSNPFQATLTSKQLITLVVLDIELLDVSKYPMYDNQSNLQLAEAEVCQLLLRLPTMPSLDLIDFTLHRWSKNQTLAIMIFHFELLHI